MDGWMDEWMDEWMDDSTITIVTSISPVVPSPYNLNAFLYLCEPPSTLYPSNSEVIIAVKQYCFIS